MNDTDASRPSARYESSRLSPGARKAVLVALVVAVIALAGGVAYSYYNTFGGTDLTGEAVRYDTLDDSTMSADISLKRDSPGDSAVCIIRAREKGGAEVARREVYFPPTQFDDTVVSTQLRTAEAGGIVDVYGCSYTVPGYLDGAEQPAQ